jgi:SAM-dependent methyltransferase
VNYDELASEYAVHRTVHPEVLRRLIATGRIDETSRVLEVGCGTGNYAGALAGAAGCRCWGVDPSAAMLSEARRRHAGVEFRAGEAGRLDFEAGAFDLVFSVDVIHHVRDRGQAFREAHRVLAGAGRVCTVTDSEEIMRGRRPLAVFFPETVAVDLARYPAAGELEAHMKQAGFGAVRREEAELSWVTADIEPYRARAFSSLHLIPAWSFERGMSRLAEAASSGGVPCVWRYVLWWGTKRRRGAPTERPVISRPCEFDRP